MDVGDVKQQHQNGDLSAEGGGLRGNQSSAGSLYFDGLNVGVVGRDVDRPSSDFPIQSKLRPQSL